MKNNVFLITLSKISKKEVKDFYNYSVKHSSEDSAANKVLAYLVKHYGNYDSHHMEERLAFRKIFTGQNFVEKKIGNAISDLRARLIEYLYWKELEQNSLEKEILILKILEKRGLDNLVKKQIKNVTNISKKVPQNMWFWMNNLRLAHEKYYNLDLEKVAQESLKIEEVMKQLDNFSAIAKLKYSCEFFARTNIINESFKGIKYLDEVLTFKKNKIPPILYQCYRAALFLNKNKKEKDYIFLKNLVFKHLDELDDRDKHILISYLTNYAANKIREGNQNFAEELFALYKQGIKHEAFIIDGYFNDMHFGNIIHAGCRLKEYKWSQKFINNWGICLKDDIREEVIVFNKAFILYEMKNYEKAYEFLRIEFKKNPFNAIKAKWLEIVCLFELEYSPNLIIDRCKAFRQFIRRNKFIVGSLEKGILNFIKFFLLLLEPNPDKSKLLHKIEEIKYISYKSWLLEKIDDIK